MTVYLDNAATTKVSEEVFEAMKPYFSEKYGNPSSIYSLGQEAKAAIEGARENAAKILGASPREIIFTSGATESNNLIIKGVFEEALKTVNNPHVITTSIEHKSVLDVCKYLEKKGAEITYLSVDKEGFISLKELENSIKENTALVTIMHGNNEVGSIQPIKEIGGVVKREREKRKEGKSNLPIYFHTDAVQTFKYIDLDVNELGVDALSLTGHKFYAPKGVGLLYIREGARCQSQNIGGGQERKRRAGTENVPYIVGMAEAMTMSYEKREKRKEEIKKLRNNLVDGILDSIPWAILTGPSKENFEKRLPNNASFCFPKVEGESILINLDFEGIAASSGSACTSGSLSPSHVLLAMGIDPVTAHGSVRFTLGKDNTEEDINYVIEKLPPIIEGLLNMSPLKGEQNGIV